jgi:hypothetical protein
MDRFWPAAVCGASAVGPLTLIASNRGQPLDAAVLAVAWALVAMVGLLVGLWSRRAAVAAVLVVWMFWHYPIFGEWWWLAVIAVGGAAWFAGQWEWVRSVVFAAGVVVLLAPVFSIVASNQVQAQTASTDEELMMGAPTMRPDVWVFIVDGYTSPTEVERQSGAVISGFVTDLEDRGFDVTEGRANYPVTYLSVASLLEQTYVADVGDDTTDRRAFYDLIQGGNATVDQFVAWGYEYVHVPTGIWGGSNCGGPETVCVKPDVPGETVLALAAMTPVSLDLDLTVKAAAAQTNPAHIVREVPDSKTPQFVLAHLMAPHPPFFFDRDCAIQDVSLHMEADLRWGGETYGEAVKCLNRQLVQAVDMILERDPDAVIVVQGDHGTGDFDIEFPEHRWIVLSALRSPCPAPLSMVNVMRTVSACLAGTEPDLLPHVEFDLSYESPIVRLRR